MRYKAIGICACAAVLVLGFFNWGMLFGQTTQRRFHQHADAAPKSECTESHTGGELCTHLPLICIDTGGREIPGKGLTDEEGKHIGFSVTPEGEDRITASLRVMDREAEYNHVNDEPAAQSDAVIHIRGNSSRFFEKSGYSIRLVDGEGNNNPLPLLGMDSHHEWVLHGPYLDKTLVRNYMMYNLAGEIMDYSPNVRFCEVLLNGEYAGVYVLTETITAGKDGARLTMSVDAKNSSFTGYLLRMDRREEAHGRRLDNLTAYSLRCDPDLMIRVEYPGAKNLTQGLKDAIEADFSRFEKALYSYDFNDSAHGWKKYIDADSFVSYFLINELTVNYDAGAYSTYIYKDTGGKLKMCVWDFNNSCDNYQEQSVMKVQHFETQNKLWYGMLMKDSDFVGLVIDKYKTLRETVFSDEYLEGYIDSALSYLGDAVERNNTRWACAFGDEGLLYPAERNLYSHAEAVEQLKSFLRERTAWIDDNIESLRQYCADSKIKKYNEATD